MAAGFLPLHQCCLPRSSETLGSLLVSHAFPHRSARAALAAHEADADKLAALEREKSDLLDKVQKMKEVRCSLISLSFCALRRGVPLY